MEQSSSLPSRKYRALGGFNHYFDISVACNASCPFCVAPTIGRKNGPGFFKGATFALNLTESVDGTLQVVGGEPMISRRLPALLRRIGERHYRRVVVSTNGSFISDKIISMMRLAGVTNVNISRHHFDERRNQEVMALRPHLPNAVLASRVADILAAGIDVRMQCVLIKGGIDSVVDVRNYVDWCNSLGCRNISFSQVYPLNLFDLQTPRVPGYTERAQIDLRRLVSEIDACGRFSPVTETSPRGGMSKCGKNDDGNGSKQRRFWLSADGTTISLKAFSGYDETGLPLKTVYDKKRTGDYRTAS